MHERITASAAACAVFVSLVSVVVSCNSQSKTEQLKQSYSMCNTRIEALNNVIKDRFPDVDSAVKELALAAYSPNGIPQLSSDPAIQKSVFGELQGIMNNVDRISREASAFLTEDRSKKFDELYENKERTLNLINAQTALGKQADKALTDALLASLIAFLVESQKLINQEIRHASSIQGCGRGD